MNWFVPRQLAAEIRGWQVIRLPHVLGLTAVMVPPSVLMRLIVVCRLLNVSPH